MMRICCNICGEESPQGPHMKCLVRSGVSDETPKGYREFPSGATRDTALGKIDPARYLHPATILMYARYMNEKEIMSDGSRRAGDNWQRGIPPEELRSSLARHHLDIDLHLKGCGKDAEESLDRALCGALFNTLALMLHHHEETL